MLLIYQDFDATMEEVSQHRRIATMVEVSQHRRIAAMVEVSHQC